MFNYDEIPSYYSLFGSGLEDNQTHALGIYYRVLRFNLQSNNYNLGDLGFTTFDCWFTSSSRDVDYDYAGGAKRINLAYSAGGIPRSFGGEDDFLDYSVNYAQEHTAADMGLKLVLQSRNERLRLCMAR